MNKCPKCGYTETVKQRSIYQNKAYFGLAVARIADQCNSTKEAMHKALAGEFLGHDIVTMPNGTTRKVPKSTKDLTTKQFCEYMERIQRWAAENGIDVPSPNEVPIEAYQ